LLRNKSSSSKVWRPWKEYLWFHLQTSFRCYLKQYVHVTFIDLKQLAGRQQTILIELWSLCTQYKQRNSNDYNFHEIQWYCHMWSQTNDFISTSTKLSYPTNPYMNLKYVPSQKIPMRNTGKVILYISFFSSFYLKP
jgi:hypothetical protein